MSVISIIILNHSYIPLFVPTHDGNMQQYTCISINIKQCRHGTFQQAATSGH